MGIFSIIGTIIVGFIVGLLARWIFPGTVPLGFWLTVGLGIGGSVVGGVIGDLIWRSPDVRVAVIVTGVPLVAVKQYQS